ncbi:delta-sarcoglycan [Drosophila subpulchrella]|uniref:delta-sarcoglycan n=1 Tax=Drosophila subpulchrella TaxID=1486046 RepID=UPI0018A14673|nr:delta-sarcoglycan [Drosophila subpulchrella]XP_037726289.1 delta-sarcoglycan [Drosophila subpulchrella]XP_037726290.1 delta-sarcoglycan [Drosophila subpulchrella]XP_037726292.1 delta-sarcoglycan [Drosophila subpulchrella]
MLAAGSSEISDFGPNSQRLSVGTTPKRAHKASSHRPGTGSGSSSGPGPMKTGSTSGPSGNGNSSGAGSKGGSGAARGGGGAMTATTVTATTGKATVSHGHGHGHGHGHARGGRNAPVGRSNVDGFVGGIETYLGLIGWRKKCLYTLLLLLMLLIITNLVLTLWILKVMEFSTEGMGQLKIVPGGIQLSGQAIIMDMLRASTIRSRHGQPISIESSRNFSINTRDPNGMIENHLFLGHDKFECLSAGFRINDTNGRSLFSVNRNEVTIGAHSLRIDGEGGAVFRESVQTPHVRAEPGRELRLESPTRQLEMTAAKDINLQSRAGGIEVVALEDVKFRALDGSLRLESSKILMPNLRTAQPPILGTAQSRDHMHRVFQLCACSNGKLFLAAPHSICAGDDSTVCR